MLQASYCKGPAAGCYGLWFHSFPCGWLLVLRYSGEVHEKASPSASFLRASRNGMLYVPYK